MKAGNSMVGILVSRTQWIGKDETGSRVCSGQQGDGFRELGASRVSRSYVTLADSILELRAAHVC